MWALVSQKDSSAYRRSIAERTEGIPTNSMLVLTVELLASWPLAYVPFQLKALSTSIGRH